MLVLTRKLQEQIRIGDNVVVTVLRVKGNLVRLGIEAPKSVSILRGELPRFDDESGEQCAVLADGNDTAHPVASSMQSLDTKNEIGEGEAESASPSPEPRAELSKEGRSLAARVEQCLSQLPKDGPSHLSFEIVQQPQMLDS